MDIYIYAYKYRCYIVSMVESWIWILDIVELEISIYIYRIHSYVIRIITRGLSMGNSGP
mgnify:CR=1 FL=1